MGRYQDFILNLLKEVMTPGYWYSIDEISGSLLDLTTKSSKKYMQLPSKHSLAQQMCRFFKATIAVKKYGNRNIYAIMPDDFDMPEVARIKEKNGLPLDTMPHEWKDIIPDAFDDWVEYCLPDDDTEDYDFEL